MTLAEAAELVLREARKAMSIKELWDEIAKRGLVEFQGESPVETLQVELARRSANSWVALKVEGPPRFYRRGGDGAYGLWAHLTPAQQRAVIEAASPPDTITIVAAPRLAMDREDPEYARRVFESIVGEPSRLAIASLFAKLISNAHAIHHACWKVTVRPNDWRLVIGSVRVVKLNSRRLEVLSIADMQSLAPAEQQALRGHAVVVPRRSPKGMASGAYLYLPIDLEQSTADAAHAASQPAAVEYARRAHGQVHNPRTHSPGMIEYLSQLMGFELPRPLYVDPAGGDEKDEGEDEDDDDEGDEDGEGRPPPPGKDDDLIDGGAPPQPPEPKAAPPPPPPYTVDDALRRVFLPREEIERLLGLLAYKRNLVLQGPPGVGKTFVAADLAYLLLGVIDEQRIKRVQFHQSYAYEDFVRGYRPSPGGGFAYRDGPMLEFCEQARRDDRPHVMIIDEINRGNLSKILGELMLLIEPDKRAERWGVELAYARPGEPRFWVPPNLYIIGTMNTADRSLALVDYALRRRFAFAWVRPAFDSSLRSFLTGRGASAELVDKMFARLAKLNAVIEKDTRNLGRGYVIGHSYFCQEDPDRAYGAAWYERIVRFEIEPLLEEYFAEDTDKVADLVRALLG